jgi:translocation and assembly module TamA
MPGRLMWLGSLEWQRPTTWGGDVGRVEQTWFVDAGAVSNRLNEQRIYVGTGTGVRFMSPVGPMQLDMAYGHQTREWRLHLFVGIRF